MILSRQLIDNYSPPRTVRQSLLSQSAYTVYAPIYVTKAIYPVGYMKYLEGMHERVGKESMGLLEGHAQKKGVLIYSMCMYLPRAS